MNDLPIQNPNAARNLSLHNVGNFEDLTQVSQPNVWLANFATNTRTTYSHSVKDFIAKMGLQCEDDLYRVTQAHIIAYRDRLKADGMSNTSITNRLSALSSMYKFLADKQLCPNNPVSGVRYPHKGTNGLGSGKTPTLSPRQVRAMLDAPDRSTLQGLRDSAILHVFFYTGGRCSAPAALKVKDFRMDR